jgi:hypothetical protein
MTDEARLGQVESGLTPATDAWFVVDVCDAAWLPGVGTETDSAFEAYARYPHWQPGRSDGWDRLPWAEST